MAWAGRSLSWRVERVGDRVIVECAIGRNGELLSLDLFDSEADVPTYAVWRWTSGARGVVLTAHDAQRI